MRVLVIEDDPDLRGQIERHLRASRFAVDGAPDGREGHYLGETETYDAVVLDLGLPERDGLSVLRSWRAQGRDMPVLILTARGLWQEKIEGFDAGADDYVAKPFHMQELTARLRALVRRAAGHSAPVLTCGPLWLDTHRARLRVGERPVSLTPQEYRLIEYLMHHPGKVVSRTELTEHLYEQDFDRDSNTIEVFVARIRKKLGIPAIETVRGLGYRLDPVEER